MYLPISAGGHFGCDFGGHVGISGVQNMLKLFVVLILLMLLLIVIFADFAYKSDILRSYIGGHIGGHIGFVGDLYIGYSF